jgi:hypothetical protein
MARERNTPFALLKFARAVVWLAEGHRPQSPPAEKEASFITDDHGLLLATAPGAPVLTSTRRTVR